MAEIVFTNGHLTVNAVDLSCFVRSMTLNYSAEILDKTDMCDDTRSKIAGLRDWSLEVEFNQDFAAGAVDATLFSLVGAATFAIAVRADQGATSATNPEFQGNALLESYDPIAGAVGELLTVPASFPGNGTLTRATS